MSSASGRVLVRRFATASCFRADARASVGPEHAKSSVPLFVRYIEAFERPADRDGIPADYANLAHALARQDRERTWQLLCAARATSAGARLPYALWRSVWTLLAAGPDSIPLATLQARLTDLSDQLAQLLHMHESLYPERRVGLAEVERYVYLLVRRVECAHKYGDITQCDGDLDRRIADALRLRVASQSAPDTTALDVMDTALLGRVAYCLASIGALGEVGVPLRAYAERGGHTDAKASAQPFLAVIEACAARADIDGVGVVVEGLKALREALVLRLPVGGKSMRRMLHALPHRDLVSLAEHCRGERSALDSQTYDTKAHSVEDLRSHGEDAVTASGCLSALAGADPQVRLHASIVLCQKGDPREAMSVIDDDGPDADIDVAASIVSSLTWIARTQPSVCEDATLLALRAFDVICQTPRGARQIGSDEQILAELARAFEAVSSVREGNAKPLSTGSAQAQPFRISAVVPGVAEHLQNAAKHHTSRDWTRELAKFTLHVLDCLQYGSERVLRLPLHAALLRANLRAKHFPHCKRLYEAARDLFPSACPWSRKHFTQEMHWFVSETLRRRHLRFAMRLLYDAFAFGVRVPLKMSLRIARFALTERSPTLAHRIIETLRARDDIKSDALARGAVQLFLTQGLVDTSVVVAQTILGSAPGQNTTRNARQPVDRHPPLQMYAVVLHEASKAQIPVARLNDLFDEFRLALAHTWSDDVSEQREDAVRIGYHSIICLHLQALGLCGAAHASATEAASSAETLAKVADLLDEVHGLDAPLGATAEYLSAQHALALARHLEQHGAGDERLRRAARGLFEHVGHDGAGAAAVPSKRLNESASEPAVALAVAFGAPHNSA